MGTQHIIIQNDKPKGQKILVNITDAHIAKEILESAEIADLDVRKLTVYTNDNIPKKKK
jgi:hypothetical protein